MIISKLSSVFSVMYVAFNIMGLRFGAHLHLRFLATEMQIGLVAQTLAALNMDMRFFLATIYCLGVRRNNRSSLAPVVNLSIERWLIQFLNWFG